MAQQPPKRPQTPFRTQPQGGPPPQANMGTETVPMLHAWPGQRVDPRTFVGPNPVLTAPKATQMTSAGPATHVPVTASAPQLAAQAQAQAQAQAPASAPPNTYTTGATIPSALRSGPMSPSTAPSSPLTASMTSSVLQGFGADGPFGLQQGRGTGVPVLGSRRTPIYSLSRLDNYFLTRLPAAGMTFWHRKHLVNGATVMSAPSTVYTLPIYTLPQGLSLIIMSFVQNWYDAGLDPLDPDALTAFQGNQDVYGRVGINLLVNNAPVFDANEILFDPDGGANTTRQVSGFTALDTNLLNIGVHPTALYARDNSKIAARFTMSNTLPSHVPSAVGVELNGYLLPTKEFQELLISVRNQW